MTKEQNERMWWLGDKIDDLVFAIQEEKKRIDRINSLVEEIIKDFKEVYKELGK